MVIASRHLFVMVGFFRPDATLASLLLQSRAVISPIALFIGAMPPPRKSCCRASSGSRTARKTSFTLAPEARCGTVAAIRRRRILQIYASPNGDRWLLLRDPAGIFQTRRRAASRVRSRSARFSRPNHATRSTRPFCGCSGMRIQIPNAGQGEIDGAFAKLVQSHISAVVIGNDSFLARNRRRILEAATPRRSAGHLWFPRNTDLVA